MIIFSFYAQNNPLAKKSLGCIKKQEIMAYNHANLKLSCSILADGMQLKLRMFQGSISTLLLNLEENNAEKKENDDTK